MSRKEQQVNQLRGRLLRLARTRTELLEHPGLRSVAEIDAEIKDAQAELDTLRRPRRRPTPLPSARLEQIFGQVPGPTDPPTPWEFTFHSAAHAEEMRTLLSTRYPGIPVTLSCHRPGEPAYTDAVRGAEQHQVTVAPRTWDERQQVMTDPVLQDLQARRVQTVRFMRLAPGRESRRAPPRP